MKRTAKPASTRRARVMQRRKSAGTLVLAAECLIDSAEALKAELLVRGKQRSTVKVDVSHVERIDTAALQLLAAFARDRAAGGLEVEWVGTTAALSSAARLLNLSALLQLPEEAPAAAA
jgi:phospholipid transport system transporter-binding protein